MKDFAHFLICCTCADVGREILRVDLSLLNKRGEPEDDPRLLIKSIPAKLTSAAPPLQEVSKVNRVVE